MQHSHPSSRSDDDRSRRLFDRTGSRNRSFQRNNYKFGYIPARDRGRIAKNAPLHGDLLVRGGVQARHSPDARSAAAPLRGGPGGFAAECGSCRRVSTSGSWRLNNRSSGHETSLAETGRSDAERVVEALIK